MREKIYQKCNGKCGYCGQDIDYKKMQVDHMTPLCNGGLNDIDNLLPTCRQCNHYKRGSNVEIFRKQMLTLHERIRKIYIYKVAINFAMTNITPFDGIFYFEKIRNNG